MSDKSFSNQPPRHKVYDSELFISKTSRCYQHWASLHKHLMCVRTERWKLQKCVGLIITLIVFCWCLFCFWRSRDGITARVGTGAGSGLVALGYSCPPANQTSAREWARVCVRVSAVWQYNYEARCRLSQAYNRRLSIVRQWEFINVQTMTHTHTHSHTRRVHTVWPLMRQMDGCWNETLLESKTLQKFWQDGLCVCVHVLWAVVSLNCTVTPAATQLTKSKRSEVSFYMSSVT